MGPKKGNQVFRISQSNDWGFYMKSPTFDKLAKQTAVHDHRREKRPREKTISQSMTDNPQGKRCSRCGDTVPQVRGIASVCWQCVQLLANLQAKNYFNQADKPPELGPITTCSQCGREIAKGRKCESCKRANQRQGARERKRRQRTKMAG